MKYIRFLLFSLCLMPVAAFAAAPSNDFMVAAQLLSAAKNADIQQVQAIINNGADVNFVDSTGLSIVCTALMNNDVRAAQILQMYGADASQCDRQIKNYRSRQSTKTTGGLFSGLSSAHTLTLAAAGAAVVVGGLLLFTDVFDPDNGNDSNVGTGNRPGGGEDGGNGGGALQPDFTIPYGPAYLTADGKISYSSEVYADNLLQWNPSAGGVRQLDYNYFRPTVQTEDNFITGGITVPMQNYLLMMHGYSSFANGYLGQTTFRDSNLLPLKVANGTSGGVPMRVSLITDNGVNAAGSLMRAGGIAFSDSVSATANTYTVDKFVNYDAPCKDGVCGAEKVGFDLSGAGTAMNPFASANENALGKIVAGWESGGRGYGDLYGFIPNGQLAVHRTGGGKEWKNIENPSAGAVAGTLTGAEGAAIDIGDTITLGTTTYTISSALTDATLTDPKITIAGTEYRLDPNTKMMLGKCTGECEGVSDIAIYVGTDGNYYFNTQGGASADAVYTVVDNKLYASKELVDADVKNYQALYNARVDGGVAIANASVNPVSRTTEYLGMDGLVVLQDETELDSKLVFIERINYYYDKNENDATTQGGYANAVFNDYNPGLPIIINAAGEFNWGNGAGKSLTTLDATFENYAPALYDSNLEHLFMTVVAVQHQTGTAGADDIAEYGNGVADQFGKLQLSNWIADENTVYKSRMCGVAGLGVNGIDPWCFAAAAPTTEMAVASAAGAAAAVKGAFTYMNNKQIFSLLALTADGAYLGSTDTGIAYTDDTLATYLRGMYELPAEFKADTLTSAEYLKAFKEVFGYGLINLERAMTPNKSIYYYDGDKIVSASGNAYWRAAQNTTFRASAAFSPDAATISAPFFDKLESADGALAMPRVWENEFAIGNTSARGLYMGDVLGELKTRKDAANRTSIGNLGFTMSVSERPYDDGLAGLDYMAFDYQSGAWDFGAGFQRYLTDGSNRFSGRNNPIMGLATNAITTDAAYKMGRWSFGTRAFSGTISDESLLENDPTLASQYMPARLGMVSGMDANIAWMGDQFGFSTSVGSARESDTVLGAQTSGLLSLGAGDTTYVDVMTTYRANDWLKFTARATFAQTVAAADGAFILGMSDIKSDAFAFGVDAGNFGLTVAAPLAVRGGALNYAYADYDIVENADGNFDLVVRDAHVERLDLRPASRELRISAEYRHSFGEFTDGAVGFVYRVNPNHTDAFGDEGIFMMKLSHRIGI